MNKQQIINKIYNEKWLQEITAQYILDSDLKEDFIQEMYTILLEYSEDKLIELYNKNQLKYFLIRICVNNYKSVTSPFYYKYIRHLKTINYEELQNTYSGDQY